MRKTKAAAADTRDLLLASALKLFIKFGYSSVNLQQIADDAGLTRGAFYWHFKSKEEIVIAICEKEAYFIQNLMKELFEARTLDPLTHLDFMMRGIINNFFENQRYRAFVELTWFKMEHLAEGRINDLKTIANEYFIEVSKQIISTGIEQGIFKSDYSPELQAIHLATVVNGIYRLYFISPKYITQETALSIVEQILFMLKKKAE